MKDVSKITYHYEFRKDIDDGYNIKIHIDLFINIYMRDGRKFENLRYYNHNIFVGKLLDFEIQQEECIKINEMIFTRRNKIIDTVCNLIDVNNFNIPHYGDINEDNYWKELKDL